MGNRPDGTIVVIVTRVSEIIKIPQFHGPSMDTPMVLALAAFLIVYAVFKKMTIKQNQAKIENKPAINRI